MKKIVVFEDDPDVMAVLEEVFTLPEYDVVFLSSGEMALPVVKNVLPDIVIIDIMMPGISGFEICHRLKSSAATRNIPLIAFTGYDSKENRRKIFEAGADDYLPKPFDIATMVKKVKNLIEGSNRL